MMNVVIRNSYSNKEWQVNDNSVIMGVSVIEFDVLEANPGSFFSMPKYQRKDLKKLAADKGVELTSSSVE